MSVHVERGQKIRFSRRGFMGLEKQGLEVDEPGSVRLEREGNVTHIYKPEATYTIIYQRHTRSVNPDQLPEDLDGLFLETDITTHPLYYLNNKNIDKTNYGRLSITASNREIPIYLADIVLRPNVDLDDLLSQEELITYGEALLGGGVLGETYRRLVIVPYMKYSKVSRADFIKGAFAVLVGGWFFTPGISESGRVFAGEDNGISADFQRLSHKLHPEQLLVIGTLRNIVMAHKQEWLARQMGNNPHFVTVIGGKHVGLETELLNSGETRLDFLKKSQFRWGSLIDESTFHAIHRFDYTDKPERRLPLGKWKLSNTFYVPDLGELVNAS